MKKLFATLLLLMLWSIGDANTVAISGTPDEASETSIYNYFRGEVNSLMTCSYFVGIPNGYIQGTQNGVDVLIFTATTSPSLGSAATYRWTAIYESGGSYTTATVNSPNSPPIPASTSNKIVSLSVRVVYQGCVKTGRRRFFSPIPGGGGGIGFG